MTKNRSAIAAFASLLAIASSSQAYAQSAKATSGNAQPGDSSAGGVDEIIVTANRREQSLQQVAQSIAAVSGQSLEKQQITDFGDLQRVVPGVSFTDSNSTRGQAISVRGIGTSTSYSEGIEGSVGIVIDGVPVGRQGGGLTDLADVERVEVLRGPQGTLYGKNASAGIINIITKQPTRELSAYASASYGEYNDTKVRLRVSGPLAANGDLRVLLSGYFNHVDGILHDIVQNKDFNGRNEWGMRGKLAYDISPTVSFLLSGDFTKRDVACCYVSTREATPFWASLEVPKGITASPTNRKSQLSGQLAQHQKTWGVSGEFNAEVLGGQKLTSITAYRRWIEDDAVDGDGTFLPLVEPVGYGVKQRQFTQEVRLASPSGDALEYVVGGFYFKQRTDSEVAAFASGLLFGVPNLTFVNQARTLIDTENYAGFGDVTWSIDPVFRLFGGARVTHERISYHFQRFAPTPPLLIFPVVAPVNFRGSSSDTAFSWRIGAKYDVAPQVMVYGLISRGYKGGGFNLGTTNNSPPAVIKPEIPTNFEVGLKSEMFDRKLVFNLTTYYQRFTNFQSESLTTDPNGQFVYDIKNAGKLSTRGVEVEVNAAPAQGLSINGALAYTDARYDVFLNAACYSGQVIVGTGCTQVLTPAGQPSGAYSQDLSGKTLPLSPRWAYSLGARYEHQLKGSVKGFVQANWSWRDKTQTQQNQDPRKVQPAYGLFDGSIGATSERGWTVSVWVKNLFDKNYTTVIIDTPFDAGSPIAQGSVSQFVTPGARRTIGGAIDFRF